MAYGRLLDHDVEIVVEPTVFHDGVYAMFRDVSGNVWDLIGERTVQMTAHASDGKAE
jgi:hypothetical protein